MIKWILLVVLTAKIAASYAPVPTVDIDIEESRKDESLVRLAYSKPIYDNVGRLCFDRLIGKKGVASAVYIGGKTCLTCAHCYDHSITDVGFEVNNEETTYYKIKYFILHPDFEKNTNYDLAVIILDRPVEKLNPLKISNDFSRSQIFEDRQYLLTYIGYAVKPLWNDWFYIADGKRRAKQTHTQCCLVESNRFGIFSSSYGQLTTTGVDRDFEPFEAYLCEGSSGGAVFNSINELVGIHKGILTSVSIFYSAYVYMLYVINIIPIFINALIFNFPVLNSTQMKRGVRTQSTPIAPLKDWIESVQRQYGEDTHIV